MKPRLKVARQDAGLPYEAAGDQVENITFAERVYRLLRRDLIAGEIAPGQSLRLEFLKQRYGSSFSPIREALNRLQSERMVASTTSRGFRAAPFSRAEMHDAAETRILIDCEAMRRSLSNGDDAWETALVTAFHALTLAARRRQALPQEDGSMEQGDERLEQCHLGFHRALISACDSRWLMELSMQMYTHTERYRRPMLRIRPALGGMDRDVGKEHQALMDAALTRDAERAVRLLTEHYRKTVELIEKIASFDDK
ncbi:GntR family transcriptional regulator [Bordetella sp. FB-8]|uniref:GntR family transcriptional regulator n=1 Tax=Bordetella sp. FB-8 TaxID=1159870 RepID=UPI000476859E|nr:FCD domain-containing protein [Bordetella sp. FB-8]